MRIINKRFDKWKGGHVTLEPTNDQDMWHIYRLIKVGDFMRTSTKRKITHVNQSGLRKTVKKSITLTLIIKEIKYFNEGDKLCIQVTGKNVQEHNDIKIGQHHTFKLQINQRIKIIKESWSPFQMNLVRELSEVTNDVENAAIIMDEGIAHLCLIKPSVTLLRHKIEKNVAKKSSGEQIYKKSLNKFLAECYTLYKMVDFSVIKCLIIASPGFLNQQFYSFMQEVTQAEEDKNLKKNLQKVILVKSSTGYLQSLDEVLQDPKVQDKMVNTKAFNQSKVLQKFYDIMNKNENCIAYGQKQVFRCIDMKAVEVLLISDHLFQTKDFKKRKVYNDYAEKVKYSKGKTVIFSSMHPSGQKLKGISGIAAILYFQVPPVEEQDLMEQNQQQIEQVQEKEEDEIAKLKKIEEGDEKQELNSGQEQEVEDQN